MTAARARSSRRIRSNSTRGKDRLEGLIPVAEDWHAKVCFLGVSAQSEVKYLYISAFVHIPCLAS